MCIVAYFYNDTEDDAKLSGASKLKRCKCTVCYLIQMNPSNKHNLQKQD